ncbi:NYN domain-containing protein [Yoonia sp. 2307UL14-13]|uniref:NYN domain-containing protein n=1 Tax=Yoonia sp. 2307UL14-13 TaxID=3126506 RepID=UPI00309C0CD4
MRLMKGTLIGLLTLLVFCAAVLPENAEKARIIDGIGKGIFVVFGLLTLGYLTRFALWSRRPKPQHPVKQVSPGRPIVVDGSNVMHWAGEPSVAVLSRVLAELKRRGMQPFVYFDANVGYKLFDKKIKPADLAARLDLPPAQVTVAPSRTPADEVLLERAVNDDLRVVTNDRFLDWKQRFPKVGDKGFLIKGMWKEGNVILLGLGRA